MIPAPVWEVFHPADGRPIGYAAAWHWLTAIEAVACACACDPGPLDAELLRLELIGDPMQAGTVRLIEFRE